MRKPFVLTAAISPPTRDNVFEHNLARFECPAQDEPTIRISREQDVDDLIAQASALRGSSTAGATDYDTIATRYAAYIDQRPWNTLYERPTIDRNVRMAGRSCSGIAR